MKYKVTGRFIPICNNGSKHGDLWGWQKLEKEIGDEVEKKTYLFSKVRMSIEILKSWFYGNIDNYENCY